MFPLASCRDRKFLADVHEKLRALRTEVLRLQHHCNSWHAADELEILADCLQNHAECIELCSRECEDEEREREDDPDPCLPVRDWHDERRGIA